MRRGAWIWPLVLVLPVVPFANSFWLRWQAACTDPTLAWPVGAVSNYTIRDDTAGSGHFGHSRNGPRTHNGIDLAARIGTEVHAAGSGTAILKHEPRGMGRYIELYHADGLVSVYGHLHKQLVKDGAWVNRGEVIGQVGKSGNAGSSRMQPHIHYELRLSGVPVDPMGGYLEGTDA